MIIHSHELHPPAMPRKYNLSCGCGGKGVAGRRGKGLVVMSRVSYLEFEHS